MHKLRRKGGSLIPPWEMPSDPVSAVIWFIHWSLKVLARFFWVLILGAVIVESILNGWVGGIVTLLVGLSVWVGIIVVLSIFNVSVQVSQTISNVNQLREEFMQQQFTDRSPFSQFSRSEREMECEGRVVEGSVTDLDEERRKRRPD